jgi:hypothetical protein
VRYYHISLPVKATGSRMEQGQALLQELGERGFLNN